MHYYDDNAYIFQRIRSSIEGLTSTYSSFVNNIIDIHGFSGRFTRNHEQILSKIKKLQSRIERELDIPLRNLIMRTENKCVDAYFTSLERLQGLQDYMGKGVDFASKASAMDIWKIPVSSSSDNVLELHLLNFTRYERQWFHISRTLQTMSSVNKACHNLICVIVQSSVR